MGSILVGAAALASPLVLCAQESTVAKTQASTPDLSGVWNKKNMPGTRYGGYTYSADEPSMTAWAQERFKANKPSFGPRSVEDSNDPVNPTTVSATGCFPPGVPRVYLHPFPMEIVQSPSRVLMIFEFDHYIRQIWTDGRPHDTSLGPTWFGDSIGHWEGDTLVVDAIGFNDRTWLDQDGHPHSEALHVTEKFTRLNELSMRYEVTIDDPEMYTKPWTTSYLIPFVPGGELFEYICQENNVDVKHLVGK